MSSQPISLPTSNHNNYSTDYHMASSSYTGSPTGPFNPASYTRHFLGSPISWRPGSLGFGGRVFPNGSPMDHMLTVEYNKQSGSYESDRGSILNALSMVDREDELCRNYQCCGVQLTDLHALIEHFEEVHILRVDNPAAPGGQNELISVPFNPLPIPAAMPQQQAASHVATCPRSHVPVPHPMHNHGATQSVHYPVPFDPDEMELEMDVSTSHPSGQVVSNQSSPSSGAPTPPDTPVSTPLSIFASPIHTSPKTEFHLSQLQVPTSPYSGSPHNSPLTSQPPSPLSYTEGVHTLEALSLARSHSEGSSPSSTRPNLNLNLTSFSRPPSSASHHQTSTPEPFNPYARYAADYSAGMPGANLESENGIAGMDGYSPNPGSVKMECVPPSLVFSNAGTPEGSPPNSGVIPVAQAKPVLSLPPRPTRPVVSITTPSSLASAIPSPGAPASLSASTPSSPISKASASLSRAHTASLLLAKPFKCPKPNCNKSYKQANGLKYHITHGSCNFAPPKDLEHVHAILERKRRDRAQAAAAEGFDDRSPDFTDLSSISESDLREVEREAELRLRPFACGVGDCQRRYKNMNGLRYHYQHSGEHGIIGLAMLANGTHECLTGSSTNTNAAAKDDPKKSKPNSKPSSRTGSRTGTPTPVQSSVPLSSSPQFPIPTMSSSSSSLAPAATAQVQAQAQLAYQQRFVDNQRAQLAQQQQQIQQLQQQLAHQQVVPAAQQQQLQQMQAQLAAMHSRLYPKAETSM